MSDITPVSLVNWYVKSNVQETFGIVSVICAYLQRTSIDDQVSLILKYVLYPQGKTT
jgi:hypothetical protein